MIVAKFGGTSVADAPAIQRLTAIAAADPGIGVVVVSALAGVTDQLIACGRSASADDAGSALTIVDGLRDRHRNLSLALGVSAHVDDTLLAEFAELDILVRTIATTAPATPAQCDRIAAAGELLSSRLVAAALAAAGLPFEWVDARRVMVTDTRHTMAQPLTPETGARLTDIVAPMLASGRRAVIGGFVGASPDGATTTIGRGGSDYTASIIGAALGASRIDIWTDVDGMMTADPRFLTAARLVPRLSFAEASELAYFGAKVLHPSTLLPAMACDTPVQIRNARRPETPGTLITATAPRSVTPLRGLACKRGVTVVSVTSTRMLDAHGFLRRVFEVFDRHRTVVDVVTTSEVSVSITVDDRRSIEAIIGELSPVAEVTSLSGMALLCAVGDRLRTDPGLCPSVIGALSGLPLYMVSQSASRQNLTLVVEERHVPEALARLHAAFIEVSPAPAHADLPTLLEVPS